MKISIKKLSIKSTVFLQSLGFSVTDSELITKNLLEAELSGRKTHGFIRLTGIKNEVVAGRLNTNSAPLKVLKNFGPFLQINAENRSGYVILYHSLDIAIKKAKDLGIAVVSIKDVGYASGYIGSYARIATKKRLIFIGLNSSPAWIVPHGTSKPLWGTNPLTIGIPYKDSEILLDMANSKIAQGLLAIAIQENRKIPEETAIDIEGEETADPSKAIGLFPIAGHKGSGLAFVIELITGALSGSKIGKTIRSGWGSSFYILINPTVFRDWNSFQTDIQSAIVELKNNRKAKGVKNIFYPGEQSESKYKINLKKGYIEIGKNELSELNLSSNTKSTRR